MCISKDMYDSIDNFFFPLLPLPQSNVGVNMRLSTLFIYSVHTSMIANIEFILQNITKMHKVIKVNWVGTLFSTSRGVHHFYLWQLGQTSQCTLLLREGRQSSTQ